MTPDTLASSITVRLGDQRREVPAASTLADLVASLGYAPNAVATAVNGEFVPRTQRDRLLHADDLIVLFQPIVGG